MAGTFMIGAIGFFLGFMAGGCMVARYSRKEFGDRIDELQKENDDLRRERRDISARMDDHNRKLDEIEKDILTQSTKDSLMHDEEDDSETYIPSKQEQYAKLASNYKESKNEFDDHFAYREYPTESDGEANDYDDIYLITPEEFNKDCQTRGNATLTFYQEDGVLVDVMDCETPIRNQQDIIGIEALDEIESTEEDYLYVSNDIQNKVYEIVIEHDLSFYRDVLGIT